VTVTLDDGTKLVSEIAYPPGHDKNPLSDEHLANKFHGLVDPILGVGRANQIWQRGMQLVNDPSPHTTISLLTRT
jgi:2-methylcitrate dehydratase